MSSHTLYLRAQWIIASQKHKCFYTRSISVECFAFMKAQGWVPQHDNVSSSQSQHLQLFFELNRFWAGVGHIKLPLVSQLCVGLSVSMVVAPFALLYACQHQVSCWMLTSNNLKQCIVDELYGSLGNTHHTHTHKSVLMHNHTHRSHLMHTHTIDQHPYTPHWIAHATQENTMKHMSMQYIRISPWDFHWGYIYTYLYIYMLYVWFYVDVLYIYIYIHTYIYIYVIMYTRGSRHDCIWITSTSKLAHLSICSMNKQA